MVPDVSWTSNHYCNPWLVLLPVGQHPDDHRWQQQQQQHQQQQRQQRRGQQRENEQHNAAYFLWMYCNHFNENITQLISVDQNLLVVVKVVFYLRWNTWSGFFTSLKRSTASKFFWQNTRSSKLSFLLLSPSLPHKDNFTETNAIYSRVYLMPSDR